MAAFLPPIPIGPRLAYKRSATPLTTGTLWTVTGGIIITEIYGIVRTTVAASATTVRLSGKNDSLTAVNYDSGTLDLTGAVAGSVIARPAALASAMVLYANGSALNLNLQNTPLFLIPTTSAVITVTYGAATAGVIDWYMLYMPLISNSTVV
jgi:hypothetical protein